MAREKEPKQNMMKQYEDKDEVVEEVNMEEVNSAQEVLANSISDRWSKKKAKPRMEDTHMKTSFLFKRNLKARLDVLSDYYGRGYRTEFINNALEFAIESAEKDMKKDQMGE